MSTLHEQARAEAEKRYPLSRVDIEQAFGSDHFEQGFLAGHEATSRPRQVSTVAELDTLPVGSVVLDGVEDVHQRRTGVIPSGWDNLSTDGSSGLGVPILPARVLYVPEETR